jgi:hypothetical protein
MNDMFEMLDASEGASAAGAIDKVAEEGACKACNCVDADGASVVGARRRGGCLRSC